MSRLEDSIRGAWVDHVSSDGKVMVAFPDGLIHSCEMGNHNQTAYSDCGYSYNVPTESIEPPVELRYNYCECVIETISPWKETKNSTK